MSGSSVSDMEKQPADQVSVHTARDPTWFGRVFGKFGVEEEGAAPIPRELRTNKRAINVLSLWISMSMCLLPLVTGITGTL